MKRTSTAVIIIALAGMVALALYLFSSNRPATTVPGAEPARVIIGGRSFQVNADPAQRVILESEQLVIIDDGPIPTVDPNLNAPTNTPEALSPPQVDTPTPTPVPPTAVVTVQVDVTRAPSVILIRHRVDGDDTLYSIAAQHNTTVALMSLYGTDQDDLLAARPEAKEIDVAVGNPAYCTQAGTVPYVIREGETLFRIAQRVNSTVATLQAINGLANVNNIKASTILCVPAF